MVCLADFEDLSREIIIMSDRITLDMVPGWEPQKCYIYKTPEHENVTVTTWYRNANMGHFKCAVTR